MTLTYEVDDLGSVPENRRDLYTPNEDGRYVLAIDGAPGLTSALAKERALRRTLEKELRPLGETPEQRSERIAALATADSTIEQIKTHAEQEKAALVAERDAARKHERDTIADTVLATALRQAKVMDDTAGLITENLLPRLNIETKDGRRTVTIMSADGTTPMLTKDGKPAGFADLMKEAKDTWPHCFEGTGAGGGGMSPRRGGATVPSKVMTRSQFDQLGARDRAERMRNGWTLTDN